MPLPPSDFSYERDVAPYAGRFFGEINRDTRLSPEAKTRLQSGLLSGVADIEKQRLQLDQERQQSAFGRLRQEQLQLEIDDYRSKKNRESAMIEQANGLDAEMQGIIDGPDLSEVKRQKLAQLQFRHSGMAAINPAFRSKFDMAMETLPRERQAVAPLTAAQKIAAAQKRIDPAIIQAVEMGEADPAILGYAMAQAEEAEKAELAKKDELEGTLKNRADLRRKLISTDLEFDKDNVTSYKDSAGNEVTKNWLKPESTMAAKQIVLLGTPEERAAFDATTDDDEARARIVRDIQYREMKRELLGGDGGKKVRASDLVR